jgi:predicted P-loop ATPase
MTATAATCWTPSSKRTPCPICGRTKDGDCRLSTDGLRVVCHHPKDLRPGEVVNGWAFTGNTSDDRAGHFTIDKPRESNRLTRVLRSPHATGAKATSLEPRPITGPIVLARLPEPEQEPPAHLPSGTWLDYSPEPKQWVKVLVEGNGKKSHIPHHIDADGEAQPKAGPDPWPLWREADALEHGPGLWIAEAEGEKCARWLQAGGLVAISQPGHAHRVEQIIPRYQRLVEAGVLGIVFLEDNDEEGRRRSKQSQEAAAAVGLPLLPLPATEVWPGLPEKGSIDDAHGTAAERVAALEEAISATLERQEMRRSTVSSTLDDSARDEQLAALIGQGEDGKLRKVPKDLLAQVIETVVPLQYNELTNRIENNGNAVDGDFLGTLYLQLAEHYGIDVKKEHAIDAALLTSRRHSYNPVRHYLHDLENRAVQLRTEDWAALNTRIFGSEDSSGWGLVHLQRQLIAAIARAMRPGCEVHTALVLHSDQQGIGKSSLWKILGGPWFSDSLGDLKDLKEDRLQLHSAWIHEWGEIDAVMGKRDSETLKRFLSCSQDDVRRPYGRGIEQLKRSCVIVGTTNRRDFIKDPTGNRRFPIISIKQIETSWIQDHRDAIWGSALAAYRAKERWHYEGAEIKQLNEAALGFAADDPLRDQIETWAEDNPQVSEAPLARILPEAGCIDWGDRADQTLHKQAASVMRAIGWARTEKKRRYLLPNGERTDNTWGWLRDAA